MKLRYRVDWRRIDGEVLGMLLIVFLIVLIGVAGLAQRQPPAAPTAPKPPVEVTLVQPQFGSPITCSPWRRDVDSGVYSAACLVDAALYVGEYRPGSREVVLVRLP